ncbi:CPBP family intramembrane metalloprotease [Streptococcus salivarius]|uniref:CPBP family intramembrane metalloprotease n=1 Tax=Streptococcus salivarius TaxID=1304 RepID=UPI000ACCC154|nr:CPBP family intramembrane metalloprotease [Streptococcus salivarius]
MTLFMSKLMSGIMELLIVSVIPFITWLIWSRKKVGFFDWIGLKKVESQKKRQLLLTILGISLLFLLFSIVVFSWFDSSQTATADFSGNGIGALPAILAYAILGTALPEEIFFRGFLLKHTKISSEKISDGRKYSLLFSLC